MNSVSKNIYWDYIGGHQWSLVQIHENGFDEHVCSVEIEKGKPITIAYMSRSMTLKETEALLNIVATENYE